MSEKCRGKKAKGFEVFSSATRSSASEHFVERAASPDGVLKAAALASRSLRSETTPCNARVVVTTTLCKLAVALLLVMLIIPFSYAQLQPTAPDSMLNTSSQIPEATGGYEMNTSGGTITWVNINATTQNPHWKAYVGNISGKLSLQDASSNAVYDWNITSMEGEIYASRKSTVLDWADIECANLTHIQTEETALNMTSSSPDSIGNTFNKKNHSDFYAGVTPVSANTCNSTNLYVNSAQSTDFEELLLYDGSYMVYTALIENAITGFDGKKYDFQMILPDSGLEGSQTPETYYFYVELI